MGTTLSYLASAYVAAIIVIFGVLTWRARKSPDRSSGVDAWCEMVFAAPAFVLFAWLTVTGFVQAEVWFAGRGNAPALVTRAFSPETYWLAQGINILITVVSAFGTWDGYSKVRRRYLGG